MQPILFATGNSVKFRTASRICQKHGLTLEQLSLDIPEIQAADGEVVSRDKALRVYEQLQKPVVISDDSWIIPGLKGFPGPFMKFVNAMFTAEDWLRLTKDLDDRRIILRQYIVYQDQHEQQLFYTDIVGVLLPEIRGQGIYPHTTISSLDGGKTSIAENIAEHGSALAESDLRTSWHDFCDWWLVNRDKT